MTCEIILEKKSYLPSILCLPTQHPSGKVLLLPLSTGKAMWPRDCPVAMLVRGELDVRRSPWPAPSTNPLPESRVGWPPHDIGVLIRVEYQLDWRWDLPQELVKYTSKCVWMGCGSVALVSTSGPLPSLLQHTSLALLLASMTGAALLHHVLPP